MRGSVEIGSSDIRVLQGLVSDQQLSLDFVNNEIPPDIFAPEIFSLASSVISYIKKYRICPTPRVLLEIHAENSTARDQIETVFEGLSEFNSSEFRFEVDRLKDRWLKQKIENVKNRVDLEHPETSLKLLQSTLREIETVREANRQYIQKTLKSYLPDFKTAYYEKIKNPNSKKGIKTGYSYLDFITNGIEPAEMVVIGGETGSGKSVLLNNMAINMWLQGNRLDAPMDKMVKGAHVMYFSLEMPYAVCFRRTLARLANVPIYSLRDAVLTKEETESVQQAGRFIDKYPFEFEIVDVPRGVTVKKIEEIYLEARGRFTPDVVVVDYLGLLEEPGLEGDDWLKLGFIAGKLHEFARTYNTRVLTAVQLNRLSTQKKSYEQHEIVGLHRFGRSSLIATHANLCLQIETRLEEKLRQDLSVHIVKNREGELGNMLLSKNFANGSVLDVPYSAPEDQFGSLISGFGLESDISGEIGKILGI